MRAIPHKEMLPALYEDAGWTSYCEDIGRTMRGIAASQRIVTAWDDTTLVGMARCVGDGETIVYVQDLLVLGAYRRKGIGTALLRRLLAPYADVHMTRADRGQVAGGRVRFAAAAAFCPQRNTAARDF